MGIFSWLFRSRDNPTNSYHFSGWPFIFGRSAAGAKVNEFTAMQTTAVYACVRILAESIAGLPLHVYEYRGNGKERVPGHPLYFLLHDSPNPEMTSFIFRETAMIHLLLWGNFFSQIIRDGMVDAFGESLLGGWLPLRWLRAAMLVEHRLAGCLRLRRAVGT